MANYGQNLQIYACDNVDKTGNYGTTLADFFGLVVCLPRLSSDLESDRAAKMNYLSVIFSIFLVVLVAKSSTAIQCYNCNSYEDTNCVSGQLSDSYKVSCEELHGKKGFTACRTVIQEINANILGLEPHTRIIRQCSMVKSNYGKPCRRSVGRGWRRYDCDCFTSDCNTLNSLDEIN
ncbi:uncharacterized protein LOC134833337 [Culicoides brevitarsis]|uniref:uncharacterized protein LOC134833337 n=1 Tax=Culicoides brevitarsis TaxID=469753 RepID=UPI00307BF843